MIPSVSRPLFALCSAFLLVSSAFAGNNQQISNSEAITNSEINASNKVKWQQVLKESKGQAVYFNAWGGSQEINQYLKWAAKQVNDKYDIQLHHVKITDTAETTSRLIAEKSANRNTNGSVDLVWINGENFKSLKDNQLLFGPFVSQLPNWKYVDKQLPVDNDFSEPVDGLEAPWGVSQLVYIFDNETMAHPPTSALALLKYAKDHPGKITYPRPPQFHGTSFLKALLIELTDNNTALSQPVEEGNFELVTKPLWVYLDQLHTVAWHNGQQFPTNQPELIQLLDDGQIDIAITFNPNEIFVNQNSGRLAETTKTYAWEKGALSNVHFLAIPWNANAKSAAMVVINFLLSPEAQSYKGDWDVWGDPSVLQNPFLTGDAKKTQLYPTLGEPHPSWQAALEKEWLKRYGK